MPPYDDWNKIDEDEDELQDISAYETKKDVVLFCIDCSESMLALYEDPNYEDSQTSHVLTALEAAVEIQKRKIIVGPNDLVGIMLFNTTRKSESCNQTSEIKKNTCLFQPISPLSAPTIQELIQLIDVSRQEPEHLKTEFPPLKNAKVPMGDVFTSCNWVFRDGAPKIATKRVFLITDDDNPVASGKSGQLITSARTTLIDLTQAGIVIEPFFISDANNPFDLSKFYSSVLLPGTVGEEPTSKDSDILPESISIARIEDLLSQMRIHEVPKRAQFSVPFHLAKGFTIGVKGYSLITEQKKGTYRYFVDLGDRMEVVNTKTAYVDEDLQAEVDGSTFLYGAELGGTASADDGDDNEGGIKFGVRTVKTGQRPFYTAEEIRSFRTLGLDTGIKLLGFKDRSTLRFEDNVKHSQFIYPDEMTYSGSRRTFTALLRSMVRKDKVALVLSLTRRNSSPIFGVLLPQEERVDESGWTEPEGFHLIPLPFADDIRAPPIEEGIRASEELQEAAFAWIDKLSVKNGAYPPDSYPNPALAFHNEQLQASAFREEYDPESFEDMTLPKLDQIHKRAGKLLKVWKQALVESDFSDLVVPAATGSKRKATQEVNVDEAEFCQAYENGLLIKMRVDQLKDFLRSKGLPVSGKKGDLIDRVSEWFEKH